MRTRAVPALVTAAMVAALVTVVPAASVAASCPDPARSPDAFDTLVRDPDSPDSDDDKFSYQLEADRLDPDAPDAYDVVLNGGGFGHGVGMSQYGARGAAELGCTAGQILTTYFPGTQLGTTPEAPYSVALFPTKPGQSGAQIFGLRSRGASALNFKLDGEPWVSQPPEQNGVPAPWYVCAENGGGFSIRSTGVCKSGDNVLHGPAGAAGSRLTVALDPELSIAQSTYNSKRYGRGTLTFRSRDHATATDDMSVTIKFPSMDLYLYGLGEVPSSWPAESLKAQAILARAYAATSDRDKYGASDGAPDDCDCRIYPSTYDQAYVGFDKEDPGVLGQYADDWPAAVDATSTKVLTYDFDDGKAPRIVRGFYSSSHGGVSADPYHVWGTDPQAYPYLQSVNTSAWEDYEASKNRLHRWSRGYTDAEMATRFGFDEFVSIEITQTEEGGRPTRSPKGATVTGMIGGERVQKSYSGESLRSKLGLHSGLVTVAGAPPPEPDPDPDPDPEPEPEPEDKPLDVARRAGSSRIETAVTLSRGGWSSSAHAVLARADNPADALAGSALAGRLDAPMLLTDSGQLPQAVADELTRLGANTAWLLGGPGAISKDVADALRKQGLTVARISGPDRFATAAAIMDHLIMDDVRTVYLVRGRDVDTPSRAWADALAVSGAAARRASDRAAWPVLGTDAQLPQATIDALKKHVVERVVPVGGPNVIPQSVLDQLESMGVNVQERIAGSNRWGTSRAIAELERDNATRHRLVLATGSNFPDGLAAGPYAAHVGGLLLLVPSVYADKTSPWLEGEHPTLLRSLPWPQPRATVVGGPKAVEQAVVDAVAAIMDEDLQ